MRSSVPLDGGSVTSMGIGQSGPCGVRDYQACLVEELRRRGMRASSSWTTSGGDGLGQSLRAALGLLRLGLTLPRRHEVIWHYSVFSYGYRGVPLLGVLLGLLLRLRGVRIVTVLHEICLSWGAPGRQKLLAFLQRLAIPFILAGSSAIVVTTSERASWLGTPCRWLRRPLYLVPVFSNIPVTAAGPMDSAGRTLGVLGYGSGGVDEDLLISALRSLPATDLRVELLGAPGPRSTAAERWRARARSAEVADRIQVTEVLDPEQFSERLQGYTLIVLLYPDGPSSRRTTLAAALVHGCAIVAIDGYNTWKALVEERAVRVVDPDRSVLAAAISELLDDASERAALGRRAADFYARHMSLEQAGQLFAAVLDATPARGGVHTVHGGMRR
jgi:hypothetical protein